MIATVLNSPWLILSLICVTIFFILKVKKELLMPIFIPSLISTAFLSKIIKTITEIERPFIKNPQVLGVTTNIPFDYAFPSLHTAIATLIAWTTTILWPKFCYLGFLGVLLIAYSRIAFGLHTVQDVAGGFFVATAAFWFFYFLSQTKQASAWSKNVNLRRKIIHLFYGLALAFLVTYQILNTTYFAIFTISLTLMLLFNHLKPIKPLVKLIVYFERKPYPKLLGQGPLIFTWSCFLATLIFPNPIATVAILNLAVGDSVNALVGYYLNHGKLTRKKKFEASLASAFATALVSLQYLPPKLFLPATFITAFFEFTEPKIGNQKIDDNIFIPLISGGIILLTQAFLSFSF